MSEIKVTPLGAGQGKSLIRFIIVRLNKYFTR